MPLVKRPNSKFWYIQFQLNHRTHIQSSRTTDRRAAEKMESQLRAQAHAEAFLGRHRSITLKDAVEMFVRSKAGRPNHRNLVGHQRTVLAAFGGSNAIDEITTTDLEEFKRARIDGGASVQTVKHSLSLISGALRLAKRSGYRAPDVEMPSVPIPKSRTRYLTLTEERVLLRELDPRREVRGLPQRDSRSAELTRMLQDAYDLVVMLLDTGARYGEVAGLQWNQVDLDTRQIRLWRSKVQNESILFMTDRVFALMNRRSRATNAEFVFTNKVGGKRTHSAASIRKAMNRAGLGDCTIHTLRHTHATRLIQNGMNIYEVKHVLGHADIKTTMRYAHLESTDIAGRVRDLMNSLTSYRPENITASVAVGTPRSRPVLRTSKGMMRSNR